MHIEYREVRESDSDQLFSLIDKVLKPLERKEFFIDYTQWELDNMFNKEYAYLHGAYVGETLVGTSQLFCNQDLLQEYAEILKMTDKKICEVGGNLVLPDYRGNQIMTHLIQLQYNLAIELGFEVIVSTVHPDNIGSVKALQRLGLEFVTQETVHEHYLRDLYYKRLV